VKRTALFILAIMLLLNLPVFAGENVEYEVNCCSEQSFIKGCILNGIIEGQSKVSLEGFGFDKKVAEETIEEIIAENPQSTANVLSFEISSDGSAAFFKYDNILSLSESVVVSAEKAHILSLIDDDMTDMEKALVVHDYMVQNYEYDTTYSIYSAEGIFKNKKGVCQAYALAFIEIMKELSIECKFVPSDAMNHAWNLIKIDGEWYHIDVTWDDPTPDLLGRVNHVFFLISDDAIASSEYYQRAHYGWKSTEKAESKKYDGCFWYDVEKPIIDNAGFWYYIKETETKPIKGQIVKRNISTGAESVIHTIEDIWMVWGTTNRYWPGCFSGIGIMDNRIFYNTPRKIYSMKLDGTGIRTELTPNTSAGYIYGIVVSDPKIIYGLSTSPNNGIETKSDYHLQYCISFDGNGGRASAVYKNVPKNGLYGILPTATREGYEFKGWYTEKDGGILVTKTTALITEDDHTLYARWERKQPEVVPEKTDGKCTVSVDPKWENEECYIYVACFKEGKLSHIERRLYSGNEEKFIVDDNSDVKIMLWGKDELSNLCNRILVGKDKFEN